MKLPDALGHISAGLDFERIGVEVVKAQVELEMSALAKLFKVPPRDFLDAVASSLPRLTNKSLTAELQKVAEKAGQRKINIREQLTAAWNSMKNRLSDHSPGDQQTSASLAELVCAVREEGPAAVLGLDLERISLTKWTSALIAIARESMHRGTPGKIPKWVAVFALRQLGGLAIARPSVELLLQGIARTGPPTTSADGLDVLTHTESLGEGMSNRWAVIVRNSKSSLTASWVAAPQLGFVLVVDRQQLESEPIFPLLEGAFPDAEALIAWEEPFETPEFQKSFKPNLSEGRLSALTQVYMYPRAEGTLKSPEVIDPVGPDAVFSRTNPPAA